MLLDSKTVLITGVLDNRSIAFRVAELAQLNGANVILTSYGRVHRLTVRMAARLPKPADVLEFDAGDPAQIEKLSDQLSTRCDRLDGVLHSIAYAPPNCFGASMQSANWDDVATSLQVSAYSLSALLTATLPLMKQHGGSIVGVDFDASQAWPVYNWMGVAKAALESTTRYLAREVGPHNIRVNLVAAGPLRTFSAGAMASAPGISEMWSSRAPLGWTADDPTPVAKACVALMSDWFPATTGEILHVDGGFHSQAI